MTYADTGCDWLKQLKTFHGCFSVLFWLKQNSFETLVQFCYAVLFQLCRQFYRLSTLGRLAFSVAARSLSDRFRDSFKTLFASFLKLNAVEMLHEAEL